MYFHLPHLNTAPGPPGQLLEHAASGCSTLSASVPSTCPPVCTGRAVAARFGVHGLRRAAVFRGHTGALPS
eukprot:358031-Chlamydomonas_euryale.AAC.6